MPKPPRKRDDDSGLTHTGETRAADALTVFWIVTVMAVLLFEFATVGFRWYFYLHPNEQRIGMFADLLYLCSALTGCISLLLLPVVWRLRRVKPPRGITLFALIMAALPIVMMLAGVGLQK